MSDVLLSLLNEGVLSGHPIPCGSICNSVLVLLIIGRM